MRDLSTVTLREILPPSISHDLDVQAQAAAIDAELRKITQYIPNVSILPRIREITDSAVIDLLAWQFHVDFYDPELPLETRRELVAKSLDWHTRKGTPSVVEEVVTAVFADAVISEWFDYGGRPFYFKISTELTNVGGDAIAMLVAAIFAVKNTRSWLEAIEILRRGQFKIFAGFGVLQQVTVHIAADFGQPSVEKANYYHGSFLVMRPEIVITAIKGG